MIAWLGFTAQSLRPIETSLSWCDGTKVCSHCLIHPSYHPSIMSFTPLSINPFTYPSIHLFLYPSIHPSIHSLIHPSIHWFIHGRYVVSQSVADCCVGVMVILYGWDRLAPNELKTSNDQHMCISGIYFMYSFIMCSGRLGLRYRFLAYRVQRTMCGHSWTTLKWMNSLLWMRSEDKAGCI
jgi:hypothetical protein